MEIIDSIRRFNNDLLFIHNRNSNTTLRWYISGIQGGDGQLLEASDNRIKKNIKNLNNSINIINYLEPKSFNILNNKDNNKRYGFIAQDLEKIYPELVKDSEKGYRKVNYMELIPLIVSKMKNMQNEIDELKKQLEIKNSDV